MEVGKHTLIFLTAQRKAWHHETPGWKEEAFERFSYIECAVMSKMTSELTDHDKSLVESYGRPDDDFRMPSNFDLERVRALAESQ
jgi:hypothetical protein